METAPRSSGGAYDLLLKILLLGDTKSNKRALLTAYLEEDTERNIGLPVCVCVCAHDERVPSLPLTSGLDYKLRDVQCMGKTVKLQLW